MENCDGEILFNIHKVNSGLGMATCSEFMGSIRIPYTEHQFYSSKIREHLASCSTNLASKLLLVPTWNIISIDMSYTDGNRSLHLGTNTIHLKDVYENTTTRKFNLGDLSGCIAENLTQMLDVTLDGVLEWNIQQRVTRQSLLLVKSILKYFTNADTQYRTKCYFEKLLSKEEVITKCTSDTEKCDSSDLVAPTTSKNKVSKRKCSRESKTKLPNKLKEAMYFLENTPYEPLTIHIPDSVLRDLEDRAPDRLFSGLRISEY